MRRKGHRRAGKRITRTRQKHKEEELKELTTIRRSSKRSQSGDSVGSQEDSPAPSLPVLTGELIQPEKEEESKEKPRDDCGCWAF